MTRKPPKRVDHEMVLKALLDEGLTIKQAAERFDITAATVRNILGKRPYAKTLYYERQFALGNRQQGHVKGVIKKPVQAERAKRARERAHTASSPASKTSDQGLSIDDLFSFFVWDPT